ncbi:hypothetical protein FKW77_002741 [Venturia effusa]|uniref:Uncharacterized protein n=1 Tax=Venturia effusa TaxID=50376 RepID=A0A517L502_9PEZI|nr:hypothetical protein FKW77_002741 [Venturia effusa]
MDYDYGMDAMAADIDSDTRVKRLCTPFIGPGHRLPATASNSEAVDEDPSWNNSKHVPGFVSYICSRRRSKHSGTALLVYLAWQCLIKKPTLILAPSHDTSSPLDPNQPKAYSHDALPQPNPDTDSLAILEPRKGGSSSSSGSRSSGSSSSSGSQSGSSGTGSSGRTGSSSKPPKYGEEDEDDANTGSSRSSNSTMSTSTATMTTGSTLELPRQQAQ